MKAYPLFSEASGRFVAKLAFYTGLGCAVCLWAGCATQHAPQSPSSASEGSGYLSETQHREVLQYSPETNAAPVELPPLPVTEEPQPSYSPQFIPAAARANRDLTVSTEPSLSPARRPTEGARSTQPDIGPEAYPPTGAVTPQMLLRYFPEGEGENVEVITGFQPPVNHRAPRSSATYQVK